MYICLFIELVIRAGHPRTYNNNKYNIIYYIMYNPVALIRFNEYFTNSPRRRRRRSRHRSRRTRIYCIIYNIYIHNIHI